VNTSAFVPGGRHKKGGPFDPPVNLTVSVSVSAPEVLKGLGDPVCRTHTRAFLGFWKSILKVGLIASRVRTPPGYKMLS
jgi:hypothetical protein